jgi:thioredoxin 1
MNEISSDKWEKEVSGSKLPVFVDFWAEWCGPCRMVSPIVEELSKEYENQVHFVKVNVDNNQEIAMKYNVLSIPTLLLLKNDQIIGQKVGASSKKTIKEWIDKTLN